MERVAYYMDRGVYDALMKPSPRSIPRVAADYTVDTNDDPNGPRGRHVSMETQNDYETRCKKDDDLMRKYWAKTVPGYSGEVGQTARKAQTEKPFDLRHMLMRIEEEFGTLSEKATAKVVRKFIADTKKPSEDITTFNRKFTDQVAALDASDMPLPEPFLVNLYLISLGFPYRAVETTVNALAKDKRTLARVMNLAKDHSVPESDEASFDEKALMAAIGRMPKRDFEAAFAANERNRDHVSPSADRCSNCNGLWHDKATCFNMGGGLSHLNSKQRREYLQKKRKDREDARFGQRNYRREDETDKKKEKDETAMAAMEAEVKEMKTKLNNAKVICDHHGIETNWDEF